MTATELPPPREPRIDCLDAAASALNEVLRAGNTLRHAAAAHFGLNGSDLAVLEHLGDDVSLNPGELARRLRLTPGALTTVVDRLSARGLVTRRHDDQDRRRMTIALTPQGKDLESLRRSWLVDAAGTLAEHHPCSPTDLLNALTSALTTRAAALEAQPAERARRGQNTTHPAIAPTDD